MKATDKAINDETSVILKNIIKEILIKELELYWLIILSNPFNENA